MKTFFRLLAATAISVFAFSANAQEVPQLPNDPAVRQGKLENGLTYYIRHNENPAGRAEFYLATHVGAIQETPDQDGLAHFLEHMCFNGTKNFPDKGILDYLQSIGASFGGNVNASTGVEQTIYMLTNIPLIRETVVDTCILIMHDYAHYVTNDPVEIDKERPVIIEERRARRDAAWRMHEESLPYYYGDTKYGKCTVIGTQEGLETFKSESLTTFYKTWYHPDMQALIVVGDVDVDKTEAKIKSIFGEIPAEPSPKAKDVIKVPDHKDPVVGIITDPEASSTSVQVLWESEAEPMEINSTANGRITDAIKAIISLVMSERFQDICAKPDAPFVSADAGIGDLCETTEAFIGQAISHEGQIIPAFKALLTEIEKAKRFGFTDAEIERAKTNILSEYETAAKKAPTRKNPELVQELIDNFFENEAYMEPNTEYQLMQQIMPMLQTSIINQVVSSMITDENMVVIYEAPEKEGLSHPSKEDLLKVIAEVKSSDIKANEAESAVTELLDPSTLKGSPVKKTETGIYGTTVWTLKNGVKVYLYPSDLEKDKILFQLYKDGGLSLIPVEDMPSFEENVFGLYQMHTGVAGFKSTELTKMLAGKNVSVNPSISDLQNGISGNTTPKDIETAFQLMYLYYTQPRFDPDEYNQGMKQIEAILPNLMNQPTYSLQKNLVKTMYGDNPRVLFIDPEIVEKASLETMEKDYKELFKDAAGAKVVIAGDFTPESIKPLVEKYFGSLPKGKKASKWVDPQKDVLKGQIVNDFKSEMKTPQTTVVQVYSVPMKYSPAKDAALTAASYILDMRYVKSLREDEGGTYGAHTYQDMTRQPKEEATLEIMFNCKPSSADNLIKLADEGVETLAKDGPTAEEFEMAKNNAIKNIPESRVRNSYWAARIWSNIRFGGDRDKENEEAVNAMTADDVKNVVAEILAAGNKITVIQRPTVETDIQ